MLIMFVLLFKYDDQLMILKKAYVYQTVISIGTALILISSIRQKVFFRKLLYPIIWYGKLSYEVYLTHMFAVYSGVRLFRYYDKPMDYALFWLAGIILVSALLGYIIERFILFQ